MFEPKRFFYLPNFLLSYIWQTVHKYKYLFLNSFGMGWKVFLNWFYCNFFLGIWGYPRSCALCGVRGLRDLKYRSFRWFIFESMTETEKNCSFKFIQYNKGKKKHLRRDSNPQSSAVLWSAHPALRLGGRRLIH